MTGAAEPIKIDTGPKTFPSLPLALDEAKFVYDEEESRRVAIETKAGLALATSSLILTILAAIRPTPDLLALVVVLVGASMVLGLLVFRLQKYAVPHKDIDEFYSYARMKPHELQDTFLLDFRSAILANRTINEQKTAWLRGSLICLGAAVGVLPMYLLGVRDILASPEPAVRLILLGLAALGGGGMGWALGRWKK